jgi:two-component system, sensor histidine kinase LadS
VIELALRCTIGPWWWTTLWILLLCALAASNVAWGGSANAVEAIVLHDASPTIDASGRGRLWVDPRGTATIAQVSALAQAGQNEFGLLAPGETIDLGPDKVLWLHYRISADLSVAKEWILEVPLPLIDSVMLFQRDSEGKWKSQAAGDTIAVSRWPQPGRYPHFYLDLVAGQTQDYFLRIDHITPVRIPVRLLSDAEYHKRAEFKFLLLGMVLGVLALLVLTCLGQFWVYRDTNYAWYAMYGLTVSLAVAAYAGVAASLLWPDNGWWSDVSRGFFALVATGAACAVVRKVSRIGLRFRQLDQLMLALSAAGFGLALLFVLVPRLYGWHMVGLYIPVSVLAMLVTSSLTWRWGDVVGLWLLAAHVPLGVATVLNAFVFMGWIGSSWLTQYVAVIAILLEVPLSMIALNVRSRDRHSALIRELEAKSQDALTGLMVASEFRTRQQLAVANFKLTQDINSAIVYFELANYELIKNSLGYEAAERCLLRSVNTLRRFIDNDCDTASRIGVARFGLIMEGGVSRGDVSAVAVRVIANGLIGSLYGTSEVTLHFHVAAVLLNEVLLDAGEIDYALDRTLANMQPMSHRQLRFLDPEDPGLLALEIEKAVPA